MIVEVQRNIKSSSLDDDKLREKIEHFLSSRKNDLAEVHYDFAGTSLEDLIEKLTIDRSRKQDSIFHFYHLNKDGIGNEYLDTGSTNLTAAQVITMPCVEFDGVWENLHFDSDIKQNLLDYSSKALLFADRGVNHNVITLNKIVLLYGPPGTGKTSICKGLAQKLAIRWGSRFEYSHFVEINAHSLFSKFFSESGKLVLQMFEKIIEIASDTRSLVFILIDEVESLAHSRSAATSGNEPSDAIRVVNALLTQLDRIKMFPNVLILATSNVESAIDGAFVDRADICAYIGHPSPSAISKILESCVKELMTRGLLEANILNEDFEHTKIWADICRVAVGVSGRSLRKLPLLAFNEGQAGMGPFLDSLLRIVKAKTSEKKLSQTHHMFQSISLV